MTYDSKRTKNTSFAAVMFLLFLVLDIGLLIYWSERGLLSKWALTEWLINYSDGFVRRGLTGAIFFFLWSKFESNIYFLVTLLNYILYVVALVLYLKKLSKVRNFVDNLSLLLVLFLPSLLLFPLLNYSVFGRKEILFYLLLMLNLYLLEKKFSAATCQSSTHSNLLNTMSKEYAKNLAIFFNVLAVPTALIYEGILFLALPINFIITYSVLSAGNVKNSFITSFFIYTPTVLATIACFIWRGDHLTTFAICESWQALNVLDCSNDTSAFGLFEWSLEYRISLFYQSLTSNYGISLASWLLIILFYSFLLLLASFRLITRIIDRTDTMAVSRTRLATRLSAKYFAFPLVASIPLYIVGDDWGRWFSTVSISYAICFLTPTIILVEIHNKSESSFSKFNVLSILSKSYLSICVWIMRNTKRNGPVVKVIAYYVLAWTALPISCCSQVRVLYYGLPFRLVKKALAYFGM